MPLSALYDARVYVGEARGFGRRVQGHALGGAWRLEQGVEGVWREKYGGRKQEEGEVAVASSPSYK